MMATVYSLSDPRTGEVRYVGLSSDPRFRFYKHLSMARTWGTYPCAVWIRELLDRGHRPELRLLEVADAERPWETEQRWMDLFLAIGCDLTNRHEARALPTR